MKLKFDSNQDYQLQAVKSVIRIFEGQPLAKGNFEVAFAMKGASIAFREKGIGNHLVLTEEQLLKNIQQIQAINGLKVSENLIPSLSDNQKTTFCRLNFTIEMETGTGKTYTFLRTVYELHEVYGFKKFVIVVPSVAIREGTIKNLQITNEHFQNLYAHPPINFVLYDRNNLTALRNFATSNAIQILVINIDSFTKNNNVINTIQETGIKPIEYLQETRPIVIIDEPQNFETNIRRQAIANLNPLCTLRYSATHRNLYNLIYSLNPIQAYDLGLVKQIEVDGITSDSNYNAAYIHYKGVLLGKNTLKAKIEIYVNHKGTVKQKTFTVNLGDDLFDLSNKRTTYKEGFILNNIDAKTGFITFANGITVKIGQTKGGLTDEVMQFQIERTVKWHFEKVKTLKAKGIKVLSLFFIDRVANYRQYDADNQPIKGKFAHWFETAFNKLSQEATYKNLLPFNAEEVHNGYFSSDKKGKNKTAIWTDTKGMLKKDNDTYALIMKEKEQLLSPAEPLQFIFSHSALREGWDNPNVFQICTLNESKSDLKKRQEIGRGLRLPVNHKGQRIQDKPTNILTVIANETYEDFSKALQNEILTETGVTFNDRIKNARAKVKIKRNKELTPKNYPLLFDIWKKISQQTRYVVDFSTEELVKRSVDAIQKMPPTRKPLLKSQKVYLQFTEQGIKNQVQDNQIRHANHQAYQIPDVYTYIQNKINLTRNTIYQILIQSNKYEELAINPQLFLDNIINCIQQNLNHLIVEGLHYEMINNKKYDINLFDFEEVETYTSNLFKVNQLQKTIFNYIPVKNQLERNFVKTCEADETIQFFFKLPKRFKIPTPVGNYTPNWVVIFESDSNIYIIDNKLSLSKKDELKIKCVKNHFTLFKSQDIEYKRVVKIRDLR